MPGNLTLDALRAMVADGTIDTVITAIPDMQGRLMGKRFQAQYFIDVAWEETHCCNYLVATDQEMGMVEGYKSTGWAAGYGDDIMKPDLATLRLTPWLEGTALVLCDLLDPHTHALAPHAPPTVLKRQTERLEAPPFTSAVATELEFFVFRQGFEELRDQDWRDPTRISAYNEDYHIFQTTKEEGLMRPIRNGLHGAGVVVENTKGEADAGQAEINVRYADALDTADTHVLTKNAVKEIAFLNGRAVTFMAKWSQKAAGSSCHIHQSLWTKDGAPAFHDPDAPHGMSKTMRHYLAGLLAHARETAIFLAPYINSYKRFVAGSFAPTKAIWSVDNRTAGFRIAGPNTPSVRVECRIGGADVNPYLALAAQIAAGIAGIESKLPLEDAYVGDAYGAAQARAIPGTLREAIKTYRGSTMLRTALGEDVFAHYRRAAEWEQEDFDRRVTDYEVRRGFERA